MQLTNLYPRFGEETQERETDVTIRWCNVNEGRIKGKGGRKYMSRIKYLIKRANLCLYIRKIPGVMLVIN